MAIDLLAACLAAGSPLDAALEAVSRATPGALGLRLQSGVALLKMGADPEVCWADWAADPGLAPLGRALARASASGAPVADVVLRLSDEQRAARHWRAQEAARSVGVKSVAPLGLCFLPAFVALGIVPMAVSMANAVLPALR